MENDNTLSHTKNNIYTTDDTIAAIASARGAAAIGVIRVSGPGSTDCVRKSFEPISKGSAFPPEPKTVTLGYFLDPDSGRILDQVMIVFFKAPNSYTGEDMIEIYCHGGLLVMREILNAVLATGVRLAQPGEFTRRAYFNGKMDLVQAESVLDIISARNRDYLNTAVRQLGGTLGGRIKEQRDRLIQLLAGIEVAIEYPDEQTEQVSITEISNMVDSINSELQRIIDNANSIRVSNEGLKVAIIGKPNVGKSSLMNRMLGHDRVIVSELPGTTRDLVGDWLSTGGLDFLIMDTAGITETDDKIENDGIARTISYLKDADIVLALFDGSTNLTPDDYVVMRLISDRPHSVIPVITKSDLATNIDTTIISKILIDTNALLTSTKTGDGIAALFEHLVSRGEVHTSSSPDSIILHIRNRDLLSSAITSLRECDCNLICMPIDIATIDIREAADALGKITGEHTTEDILASIFNNFCVGK